MMKIAALAASIAVAAGLAAAPVAQAKPKLTGEARLAQILDGRVAGKPVSCIPLYNTQDSIVVDKTAIVYKVGSTYYVNRPTNADRLDDDDILVTKTSTSQLCNVDTIQLHQRGLGNMWTGFVGLNEFVPYTKVRTAAH
jgi:hypothetical protein